MSHINIRTSAQLGCIESNFSYYKSKPKQKSNFSFLKSIGNSIKGFFSFENKKLSPVILIITLMKI